MNAQCGREDSGRGDYWQERAQWYVSALFPADAVQPPEPHVHIPDFNHRKIGAASCRSFFHPKWETPPSTNITYLKICNTVLKSRHPLSLSFFVPLSLWLAQLSLSILSSGYPPDYFVCACFYMPLTYTLFWDKFKTFRIICDAYLIGDREPFSGQQQGYRWGESCVDPNQVNPSINKHRLNFGSWQISVFGSF